MYTYSLQKIEYRTIYVCDIIGFITVTTNDGGNIGVAIEGCRCTPPYGNVNFFCIEFSWNGAEFDEVHLRGRRAI